MPSYYLKLLPFLQKFATAAGADADRWAQDIFEDLTSKGTQLLVDLSPISTDQSQIGLSGSKYHAEAVRDRERKDTLFLTRITRANANRKRMAKRHEATCRLITPPLYPNQDLDSIDDLFSSNQAHRDTRSEGVHPTSPTPRPIPPITPSTYTSRDLDSTDEGHSTPPILQGTESEAVHRANMAARPSPRLSLLLKKCPPAMRALLRPQAPGTPETDSDYVQAFRIAWRRHRLDTYAPAGVSARTLTILNGTINPASLSSQDKAEISSLFGIPLLNKYLASRSHDDDAALALLADLGTLPMPPAVRATLWAHCIRSLPDNDLRRELYASAPGLTAAGQDKDASHAVEKALIATFSADQAAGSACLAIAELLDLAADNPGSALTTIAEWASKLEVRSDVTRSTDAQSPQDEPTAAEQPMGASTDQPQPAKEVAVSSPLPPEFDQWVLSLRFPNLPALSALLHDVGAHLLDVYEIAMGPVSIATTKRVATTLLELSDRVQSWKRQLPSADEIASDEGEARQVYEKAREVLGPDLVQMIAEGVRPDAVREVADIMCHRDWLAALPGWVWPTLAEDPNHSGSLKPDLWRRLLDVEARRRALLITQLLKDVPDLDPGALSALQPPEPGASVPEYIEASVRQLTQFSSRLKDAGPLHAPWLAMASRSGVPQAHVVESLEALERISDRVSAETFGDVLKAQVQHACNPALLLAQSLAVEKAVRIFETEFGSTEHANYPILEALIERRRLTEDVGIAGQSLSIQHNFLDWPAQRAELQVHQGAGQLWGMIYAPVILESDSSLAVSLRLEWTGGAPWRDHWPSDWPGIEPSELRIGRSDWRTHPKRVNAFVFSFKLCIPVRRMPPGSASKKLSLSVVLKSLDGRIHMAERDLEWSQVNLAPKTVLLEWQDSLNPNFVKQHPIGPQRDVDTMVERLQSGHSFAVLAPRRFGKSTLLEYLRSLTGNYGLAVAAPIVCTRLSGSSGVEPADLWREISERVRDETGEPIDVFLEHAVPRGSAFDAARRAVAARNGKTLVLLFDEAQALFKRGPDGYRFGDRLKDAIEHSWSRRTDVMAGVAFVLVGLPGLLDRAGSNLMGALRPFKRNDIDESDLNRLLLEVTQGALQTTRGARVKIAGLSKNLLLLRELLERLVRAAREDGRTWISTDDVTAVEIELREKLREGQAPALSRSLRDVFNEAESVNEWKPSGLYPVAAAMAQARFEGLRSEVDVLNRVVTILNDWAGSACADYLKRVTFESGRIRDAFRALREGGIVRDGELAFGSPLLEAWLLGIAGQGVYADDEFYPAMLSSAVTRVRRPLAMTPIDEGGQARLYRFSEGDDVFAYREALISSDLDRSRFVETVDALGEVMRRITRRAPGSEYVFDLRAIGLREDDECVAVQVYRWIEGEDLSGRAGRLPALAVAELGLQTAQAVAWLHGVGVIHRDLHPKNVILGEEAMRPVLIDFGLARLEGRVLKSAMASAYSAPEVRGPKPRWTKAADVWSLGVLLEGLLRREEEDIRLRGVLSEMQMEDFRDRPTAEELVDRFKVCAASLSVQQQKDDFFARVLAAAGDSDSGFFSNTVRKFRARFEAAYLGLFPTGLARAAEAADFLNQVLEAWGKAKHGRALSLGAAKHSK